MAFQVGTRVRPELGDADYSGFARAAEIQANTLAQLGATIGGAIAASKQKKQEKALSEQAANLVFSFANANPEAGKQLGIETLDDAKVVVKTLGGAKPTLGLLMELQSSQQEDPTTSTQMISIGRMLERPEFKDIKFDETGEAFMEIPNKDTLMPFDKKRIPVPESVKNIPGFEDYAASRRTVPKVDTNQLPNLDSDDPILLFQ